MRSYERLERTEILVKASESVKSKTKSSQIKAEIKQNQTEIKQHEIEIKPNPTKSSQIQPKSNQNQAKSKSNQNRNQNQNQNPAKIKAKSRSTRNPCRIIEKIVGNPRVLWNFRKILASLRSLAGEPGGAGLGTRGACPALPPAARGALWGSPLGGASY